MLAMLICLAGATLHAFANDTTLNVNVDPPRQLGGHEAPPIRMAEEHLTIYFGREECRVLVEFTFVNEADYPVYTWAGFPDEDLLKRWMFYGPVDAQGNAPDYTFGGEALWGDYAGSGLDHGALRDFTSWTRQANNNQSRHYPLETKLVRIERIAYEPAAIASLGGAWTPEESATLNGLMFCHAFPLNLEAHDTMVVGHSYTTLTGSNVERQHLFNYTLGTGRSWAGTIGKATIDVHFEDGLTVEDLRFPESGDEPVAATSPALGQWEVLSPNIIRLVWEDFEPEGERSYIMLATKIGVE